MNQMLKTAYANLEPVQVMQAPTGALLGVSPKGEALLKCALNIRTVFDLATSRIFNNASLIVRSAEGESTVLSRSGLISSDIIDHSLLASELPDFQELVSKDVACLSGIGPHTGPQIRDILDTTTVRDLAYWPPFVNARTLLESFAGEKLPELNDGATPSDLLPISGQYPTERTQYSMLLFERLLHPRPLTPIEEGISLDVMTAQDMLASETTPALGALASYTQSWYTLGLALGQLLHSLALAPGESTRVAVIDWYRRLQSRLQEAGQETETLVSDLSRNRSLNEVVSAVATEFQRGSANTYTKSDSENFGVGFGYGTGTGTAGGGSYGMFSGVGAAGDAMGLGFSGGAASGSGQAWTWSSTLGKREMAADMAQRVLDQTHQSSMAARDRWASVVREVSQEEHESLSTRSVTNFNHMHALTVQYYEVIQIYRVVVELAKVTRCLFVPMRQLDFTNPGAIKRFRYLLARAALSQVVRTLANAEPDCVSVSFPSSGNLIFNERYSDRYGTLGWTRDGNQFDLPKDCTFKIGIFRLIKSNTGDFPFVSIIVELQDGTKKECALVSVAPEIYQVQSSAVLGQDATIELADLKRIWLRKSPGKESFTGGFNNIDLSTQDQHHAIEGVGIAVPAGADPFPVWEISGLTPKRWAEISAQLQENRLYYSQAIWQNMDSAAITHMLSGYSFSSRPLLNLIDSKPIGVAGCYLVFPLNLEDESWSQFLHSTGLSVGIKQESLIPLPSGGVFAEAVLGRANSAEKLDITRFWNWADSPIPITAPEISALSSESRENPAAEGDKPSSFGAPLLNIVNPPALPDPTSLAAILTAIQNGNMFRDMSGLSGAIQLAQSSLANAMQAAQAAAGTAADEAKSAMQQAGKNLATAAEAFENVYGKGGKNSNSSAPSNSNNAPSTISNLGAKLNAAEKLDRQSAANGSSGNPSSNGSAEKQQSAAPKQGSSASTPTSSDTKPAGTTSSTRQDQVLGVSGEIAQADFPGSSSGETTPTATDAQVTSYSSTCSDTALLDSRLATDPTFNDVNGFIFLLEAVNELDIIPLLIRRFDSLGTGIDAKQKYAELVSEIKNMQSSLTKAQQMLFCAAFVKNGIWPDLDDYSEDVISEVKDQTLHLMTRYVLGTAQSTNPDPTCYDIVNSIFKQACTRKVTDINHLAYMLATAHHESKMGCWMFERAPENYSPSDPDFARDAYFFDCRPGKASYNGVNGNLLAGDQLLARCEITLEADKKLWNGTSYPHSQPESVKLAARECDFYRFSGKGLVQVTGRANYRRYSNMPELDNVDFEADPDKVTEFQYAAGILVFGLEFGYCHSKGWKLSKYDDDAKMTFDAFNARDIVNADKKLFPKDQHGNPSSENFGERIRRIASQYKANLIQFPQLEESRQIVSIIP